MKPVSPIRRHCDDNLIAALDKNKIMVYSDNRFNINYDHANTISKN